MADEHTGQVHHVQHRLRRTMYGMTGGVMEDQQARDDELAPTEAGIYAQHMQVAVSGRVWRKPHFQEFELVWPHPFLMRLDRRGGDMDDPHFAYGVHLITDHHMMLDCQIKAWHSNDSDMVTGCTIRVCTWAPEARKKHLYSGVLHLTFTGFAAPYEDIDDEADDDDDDDTLTLEESQG